MRKWISGTALAITVVMLSIGGISHYASAAGRPGTGSGVTVAVGHGQAGGQSVGHGHGGGILGRGKILWY
ncbi:MAG: hypothetical protein ACP5QO_16060 [Clostridia bacterium]